MPIVLILCNRNAFSVIVSLKGLSCSNPYHDWLLQISQPYYILTLVMISADIGSATQFPKLAIDFMDFVYQQP